MSQRSRVLTALSGGVDSSVAALLLQERGYEVIGAFLRNGVEAPPQTCRPKQGCCSVDDARDAALVADRLGIPYHAIDMQEEFAVIQSYFRAEYEIARTPNPCAVCNRDIKFGALLKFADAVGADFIATGHYARIVHGSHGPQLRRGVDTSKDQSYVLFPVGPEALQRTLLPVGGMLKTQTRALAKEAGLPVFGKPDSQEICFVPTGDYRDMLQENGGLGKNGRFVHVNGEVLGEHAGHMGFTRGQRRGLGIAHTEPLYVVDVDSTSGDVLVGPRSATFVTEILVEAFQTFGVAPQEGAVWNDVQVQYRSTPGGVFADVDILQQNRVRVRLHQPAGSVAPGQGLAIYHADRLLGGGWIQDAPPLFEEPRTTGSLQV